MVIAHVGVYTLGPESSEVGWGFWPVRMLLRCVCPSGPMWVGVIYAWFHICVSVSLKSGSSALALAICRICGGKRMPAVSTGVHTVISRTCACVTWLEQKGAKAVHIWRGNYTGFTGGPLVITRICNYGRRRSLTVLWRRLWLGRKAQSTHCVLLAWTVQEKGQGMWVASRSWKGKEVDSPLSVQKRAWQC